MGPKDRPADVERGQQSRSPWQSIRGWNVNELPDAHPPNPFVVLGAAQCFVLLFSGLSCRSGCAIMLCAYPRVVGLLDEDPSASDVWSKIPAQSNQRLPDCLYRMH